MLQKKSDNGQHLHILVKRGSLDSSFYLLYISFDYSVYAINVLECTYSKPLFS